MRYLVLSDLHSNLEALEAVLESAGGEYDRVLVLGDLVGYGADPNGVLDRLRSIRDAVIIRGNHDRVAAGLSGADGFNPAARRSADWTRAALRPDNLAWLAGLPRGPVAFGPGGLLAHGTPLDEDTYLLDPGEARHCFEAVDFAICLFGHTHFPAVYSSADGRVDGRFLRGDHADASLDAGMRHMLNPGSVGQPRDRNPKCSFALYDEAAGRFTVHRVDYAIEEARRKILEAGLPSSLGDRLRAGL